MRSLAVSRMTESGIRSMLLRQNPPHVLIPASYFKHIPYSHSSSASPNLNDHVANIDAMLEEELGSIYTDVLGFDEAYFGAVEGSFRHQVSHAMVLLLFGGILAYGKHAGAIIIPPSLNVWAFNSHIMVHVNKKICCRHANKVLRLS